MPPLHCRQLHEAAPINVQYHCRSPEYRHLELEDPALKPLGFACIPAPKAWQDFKKPWCTNLNPGTQPRSDA